MSIAHNPPPTSLGDDPDDSRVHFGPFMSPEKKYLASDLAVPQAFSPLRRSPRFSSPIPPLQTVQVSGVELDINAEDETHSRSATPENENWVQDEPSSALASRISRAHDNPSPPPPAPEELDSAAPEELETAAPTPDRYHTPAIPFLLSQTASVSDAPREVFTEDLISFDSVTTPLPNAPDANPNQPSSVPSIDDLLSSWSPPTQAIRTEAPPVEVQPQELKNAEEVAVIQALMGPNDIATTSSLTPPPDSELPRTPLRRSTRPRRSGTPHAHLFPLPSSEDESDSRTPLASARTRRKGREREEGVDGLPIVGPRATSPRRQPGASHAFNRELGSLSPSSVNVLTQLISPPSPPPVVEQPNFVADLAPQSAPNGVNNTPARRIPIDLAVTSGQISPQRGAQLLAQNSSRTGGLGAISRTPVLRVSSHESPARRVPVSQINELTSPTRPATGSTRPNASPTRPNHSNAPKFGVNSVFPSVPHSSPSRILPFPLTPVGSDRPRQVLGAEPRVLTANGESKVPASAPVKKASTLKQTTSRIPRGTKPYARPSPSVGVTSVAKTTLFHDSSSRRKVEPAKPALSKPVSIMRSSKISLAEPSNSQAGPSTTLKRKRLPSPPRKPRPVAMPRMRMVEPPESHISPSKPVSQPPPSSETVLPAPDLLSQETVAPEESAGDGPRRTARVRKAVFPSAPAISEPLSSRRKAPAVYSESGVFANMTAVALKALTSANTNKNQHYLAAKLETQVVRRDGQRPESPAVKIRTIAQREQDERGAQRRARAARRANQDQSSDTVNDESDGESDPNVSPVRHARGPGDEEQYLTPRLLREDDKKRVRWDRGLATTVYLDEVEPRPRLVTDIALTPICKTFTLDSLGNHLHAQSPLQDLTSEYVVIKKFVYDNDVPEEPAVLPKTTRSKSKKKS